MRAIWCELFLLLIMILGAIDASRKDQDHEQAEEFKSCSVAAACTARAFADPIASASSQCRVACGLSPRSRAGLARENTPARRLRVERPATIPFVVRENGED